MATNKNIERLKKVQADAKKLKAKNTKLSHIEAVKKAWAMQPKADGAKIKKTNVKKYINDGRKDWQLYSTIPKGWREDKYSGHPPKGYIFITDGKSILNGGKRGITPVSEKVGATMIIEKGESPKTRPTKVLQIKRSKKGTFEKFKTVGSLNKRLYDVKYLADELENAQKQILQIKARLKDKTNNYQEKQHWNSWNKKYIAYIKSLKRHLNEAKKMI